MANNIHNGSCFCGEVKFEVSGQPARNGILSLRILPSLVRRTRQRVYVMEARGTENHSWRCQHRYLQQDADQLSQVVQEVRRASVHRASDNESRGHLCRADSAACL